MTKDELWEKFNKASWSDDAIGRIKEAFEEVIVPYLAIPRSLKDDPPEKSEHIICLGDGKLPMTGCGAWGIVQATREGYTHWIVRTTLPQIDKEQLEFDKWWVDAAKNCSDYGFAQSGWMARARKKS